MEKELHEKMQFAWKSIAALRKSLGFKKTHLRCSFRNYVKIDNKWKRQDYPIPTFQIEGIGEVGYDYDKFFLVVVADRLSVTREFIEDLLRTRHNVSIYGARDFLRELSNTRDLGRIFRNIEECNEEVVQIEIDFSDNDMKNFREVLEKLCTLFERHGIKIES